MLQARESPELIRKAEEIKLRAERRAGELLKDQEKAQGRRTDLVVGYDQVKNPTLKEQGIEKDQSSNWQRIASIPEKEFEEYINTKFIGDKK